VQRSAKLKLSIGVRVLDSILQGLTGAPVGGNLEGAFEDADGLVFSFEKPEVVGSDLTEIGKYLAAGDFNTKNAFLKPYLDDDAQLYLITSVLQSASIKIEVSRQGSATGGVDVNALKKSVKGKLSVERSSKTSQVIEFTAKRPATFGFEAFELTYADDVWRVFSQLPAGKAYLGGGARPKATTIFSDGRRVLIQEKSGEPK